MIQPLIEEIVAVANARNVDIKTDDMVHKIEGAYPESTQGLHYPSMHQDLHKGRLTEIDFLNGQIAKYGKDLNISTPLNTMLTHQVHELELDYV